MTPRPRSSRCWRPPRTRAIRPPFARRRRNGPKRIRHEALSWVGRTRMAVGISGAAFAALCCVAPFLVADLVTAVGLGVILNDALLIGLLVLFIGVAALGSYFVRRQ